MMDSAAAYLLQRRMAQVFVDALGKDDYTEMFLEDLSNHLRVWPSKLVLLLVPAGRRIIERIAMESGYRIRVVYRPGVIRIFVR
jgi:hypothetical protein